MDFQLRQFPQLTKNKLEKNNVVESHLTDKCQLVIVLKRSTLGEAVSKGLTAQQHLVFIDLSRLKCIFFNNYFQLFIFLFRFFEFFVFSKSSSPDEVVSANLFFTRLQLYDVVLTGLTIQKAGRWRAWRGNMYT